MRSGSIPNSLVYDNIYGKNHWGYKTIFSISIGEGELLTTPLQMANLAAIIANRGYYREPHPVRDIGGLGKPAGIDLIHNLDILPKHFETVVNAMQKVIEDPNGTGNLAQIDGITICGEWAAPIAGLLVEKYLTDTVSNTLREERILTFQP